MRRPFVLPLAIGCEMVVNDEAATLAAAGPSSNIGGH